MKSTAVVALVALVSAASLRAAPAHKLVTPDPMPEAVALFDTLQAISGRYVLIGQHNHPATGARNSRFSTDYTGKIPAVWTSDLGFAEESSFDSYKARGDMVQEAIRQHRMGAIVSLCWHAVPPTADEPVTFRPKPDGDPAKLQSVQGKLLDEQFRDVLTPGTGLHRRWEAQVDAVAVFLKQLQDAHVPVLWRPYHEMNGDWFWWGGRWEGEFTTAALYRQIFDRLVNHHHLKNLVWLWSVDRVSEKPEREHAKYFPGIEYLDVLGLDVYGSDFAQSYYDSLVQLSQGKPLALAEVGNPPSAEVMKRQPLWTYYATWAGMVRNTTKKQYATLLADSRLLAMNDAAYADAMAGYRAACGLPRIDVEVPRPGFTGTWVLNEDLSTFGPMGASFAPAKLALAVADNVLTVQRTRIREFADDEITDEKVEFGGVENKTKFMDFPRTTTAQLAADGATLSMVVVTEVPFAPDGKVTSTDTWTLTELGDRLTIHSVADSFMGPGKVEQTIVFDRR